MWGESGADSGAGDDCGSSVAGSNSDCRFLRPGVRLLCALALCVLAAGVRPSFGAQVSEPPIVSREAWGARPPDTELMTEQKPAEIVIHHTGERAQPRVSLEVKLRGFQGFAMSPGKVGALSKPAWGDVPYHYYIDVAGRIGEGRDPGFQGDAVTNIDNEDRIHIVLEGDFEREQPGKAELESLTKLVTWLAAKYAIAPEAISGHADHDQTNCPGRNLKPFLEELRKAVRAELYIGR
jgi:hypothetical protein